MAQVARQAVNLDKSPDKSAVRIDAALVYQSGFGNQFSTEAVAGALPIGRNSPQRPPLGLYAGPISGPGFSGARQENPPNLNYRIRPSVVHKPYKRIENGAM